MEYSKNPYKIIDFPVIQRGGIRTEMLINSSVKELEEIMNAIDSYDETSDFEQVTSLCSDLVRRLPLAIRWFDGEFLLRARKNDRKVKSGKWEIFGSEKEISYNPNPQYWGRFNRADESIFYASIPQKTHNNNGALTAIMETCKELTDPENVLKKYLFTVSRWLVTTRLYAIQLTFYSNAEIQNPYLPIVHNHYLSYLRSSLSKEDFYKVISFYNYFAIKAAKAKPSMKDYFISTSFFHAIRRFYGNDVGIIFSSAMTENTGLNVCFSTQPIDQKFIRPHDIAMFTGHRDSNDMKNWEIVQCTRMANVDQAGNFFLIPELFRELL
jgi:hypothetical protein